MPYLPPVTIPADAFEKAEEKGKTVDFYAELTDEERIEEELPPREAVKSEPEPGKKPEPEPASETEDEPEPESDTAIESLFDEVARLREDIASAIGKPEPAPAAKEDELLQAAREHDDPVVSGMVERVEELTKQLAELQGATRVERIARQQAKDDADFEAVQKAYNIGGKPMTERHIEQVEDYILQHPDVGSRLSIEQITRVLFQDAVRVGAKPPPAKGPGDAANGDGPIVATIVDSGSPGGAAPERFKPRANETIESAISEAGKRFGWKR